jgi:hypothetical protein
MGLLGWLVGTLVAGMKWLVCAIIGGFLYWIKAMLIQALDELPEPWTDWMLLYSGGFYEWYKWGNKFVPLGEMFGLLWIYLAWCVVCRISAWAFRMLRG